MLQKVKNEKTSNEARILLAKNGAFMMIASGAVAASVFQQIENAPKTRKIVIAPSLKFPKDVIIDDLKQVENKYVGELNFSNYGSIVKDYQAQLANIGLPVIDIYGVRKDKSLYGIDMGFEIVLSPKTSIFADFGLCFIDGFNRIVNAFSIEKGYHSTNRECCRFDQLECYIDINQVPRLVKSIFSDVSLEDISFTPTLDIMITNIYTDQQENTIKFFEAKDGRLYTTCAIGIIDSSQVAANIRQKGTEILARGATSTSSSDFVSVGTAKILQADCVESLGDMLVVETVPSSAIENEVNFEDARYKFLDGYPTTADQYKLAYAAGLKTYAAGSFKVINEQNWKDILDHLIGQQPSLSLNSNCHQIYSQGGDIIGFLSNGSDHVVYEKSTSVATTSINKLICSDHYLEKDDVIDISVETLNQVEFKSRAEKELQKAVSRASAINLEHIRKEIAYIDKLVAKTFNTLASIRAANDVMNARTKTLLTAIEQLLKFQMKTAYSAYSFGTLAEFLSIRQNSDYSVSVDVIYGRNIPYMRKRTHRECGKTYTINNGDPGEGYSNDVLITPTMQQMFRSVRTGSNLQLRNVQNSKYTITKRQTHGSGKCETEVVPFAETEIRGHLPISAFLEQAKNIVLDMFNDPAMKDARKVTKAIEAISNACDKYNAMRKPFQDDMIAYFEAQEDIFWYSRILEIYKEKIHYESGIKLKKALRGEATDIVLFDEYRAFKNEKLNSISSGLALDDIEIQLSTIEDSRKVYNDSLKNIRYAKNIIIAYRDSKNLAIPRDEVEAVKPYLESLFKQVGNEDSDLNNSDVIYFSKNTEGKRTEVTRISTKLDIPADFIEFEVFKGVYSNTKEVHLTVLEDDRDAINDLIQFIEFNYQCLVKTINETKKKITDKLKEKPIIRFKDTELAVKEVENDNPDIAEFEFRVEINSADAKDQEYVIYRLIKEKVTGKAGFEEIEVEVESAQCKITIYPIEALLNINNPNLKSDVLSVGCLSYELGILLKHEHIFGFLPKSDKLLSKIKLLLCGADDVSDSDVYKIILDQYGQSIANYFTAWNTKRETFLSLCAATIYSVLAAPELAITTIMAYQETNLGMLLNKKGYSPTNVGGYEHVMKTMIV